MKISLLFAINLFFACSLFAQMGVYEGTVFAGISAAGQSTKFSFSEDFSDAFQREFENNEGILVSYTPTKNYGYSFGTTFGININTRLGVLIEPAYSYSRYDYEIDNLTNYLQNGVGILGFEEKFHTISISSLVRFQPIADASSFYGIVGPNFLVGVTGTQKSYFESTAQRQVIDEISTLKFKNDRFADYKAVVPGFTIGAGYAFYVNKNTRFTAEIRSTTNGNLYSDKQLNFLSEIDERIVGKKKLRATVLRFGVEYIFSTNK